MNKLYYGADYNPDQWLDRPDILEQDIELMKKAKVNFVSLGIFAWSTLEPEEGRYNLDWMEEIINRLYQNGVCIDLATPSGARPVWMAHKYPEVRRVNADRVRQLFGERHNHCYTSPVYRQKVRLIDQALARRFGSHPAVKLWHISNEFGGDCHCELCQQAFRRWLQARYGTIDALNKAWNTKFWSHEYAGFDQIESPAPHGEHTMHGLTLDWQRFVSHQTTDFMKWERDSIREILPNAKVCVNMMYRFAGIDYFNMAREVDLVSWDSYPTWHHPRKGDENVAIDTAMMHDLFYSLKGQPFLLMESSPSFTNWQPVSKVKKPGMNLFSSLQAIAHGSDSVMYFQWRQSRGASEKFHGAVVSHDCRADNRVFMEAAAVGEALEQLAQVAGERKEKQAAILHDWNNHWALHSAQGPRNAGMGYWEEITLHYSALARNGVSVDFIHEESDLSGYALVILPMAYMLREDFAKKLREYTAGGGTLVVTYWSGVVDESDLCYLGDTPHLLTDVLGLRRCEIDGMYDGETRRCAALDGRLPQSASGSALCEVAALEGAEPMMLYDEDFFAGTPAVAVNTFGKGKAYYLATRFNEDFYPAFYKQVCSGVCTGAWAGSLPKGVLAVRRGAYIFLQNTQGAPVTVNGSELTAYGTRVYADQDGSLTQVYPV